MTPRLYIEEPTPTKNKSVIDFVTEADQIFIDSMPDTRKFIRLALPGEVDGKLPVLSMRIAFQNDAGALFKGLVWPPWGQYTCADLSQFMLINDCGLEELFYKSYKIKMDKDVTYTPRQQCHQLFNGIIDTVVYKDVSQLPSLFWYHFEDSGAVVQDCAPIETKTGYSVMFFDSMSVNFEKSAEQDAILGIQSQRY